MHRDTSFGDNFTNNSNHGLDGTNDNHSLSGDNFSSGNQDFWKDTYQGIANLGHHDHGHHGHHGHGRGHHGHHEHTGHHGRHGGHSDNGSQGKQSDAGSSSEHLDFGSQSSIYGDCSTAKVSDGKTDAPNETEAKSEQVVELLNQILELERQLMQYLQRLNNGDGGGAGTGSDQGDSGSVAPSSDQTSTPASDQASTPASDVSAGDGSDHTTETPRSTTPGTYSLQDALDQNDMNKRAQVIADIPFHGPNSWADGKAIVDNNVIPPGIEDFAPWSVVSQEQGKVADRDTQVTVGNQHVYYHKKGGGWVEAANPDNTGFWEGRYYNNFQGNASFDDPTQKVVDGGFQFQSAPEGQVNHLGNGNTPVRFDPNLYDGVFERLDAKADRDNSNLVIDLAGDYYRPSGKIWGEDGQNDSNLRNPGAGTSNWTRLTSQTQTLYYTTMDADTLRNEPPPGMS